jgi:hypothetical protein
VNCVGSTRVEVDIIEILVQGGFKRHTPGLAPPQLPVPVDPRLQLRSTFLL